MPHLILEYSANVIEKTGLAALFSACHGILTELLPADLANCKSRAIACEDYCVGEGRPQDAFVHVTVKVLPGRTPEVLQRTAEALMRLLEKHFATSRETLNLEMSVEIGNLSFYCRSQQ